MSQTVNAPSESRFPSSRALSLEPARVAAACAMVVMFVISVLAIAMVDLNASTWVAIGVAATALIAGGLLAGAGRTDEGLLVTTWTGVAACTFAAIACVLATVSSTGPEMTVLAAALLGLTWTFWVHEQSRNDLRLQSRFVLSLAVSIGLITAGVIILGWSGLIDSDDLGLLLVAIGPLAIVTFLGQRLRSQLAALVAIGGLSMILSGAIAFDEWAVSGLALLVVLAIALPTNVELQQIRIGRFDPWVGALAGLALFGAGVFSLDDPVRSFAFGGSVALAAAALFGVMLQVRERETRVAELLHVNAAIQDLARLDYLTGLPNREALEIRLAEEVERSVRYRQPLSLCFVDIDHFKSVNDTLGHQAGDLFLQQIASVIRATIRTPDFVARYGGEEFVVIAPGTWTEDAIILGARIQNAIASDVDPARGRPMTVSIGIAGIPEHGTSAAEIVALADQALYAAKEGGRNKIAIADGAGDQPRRDNS